RGACASGRAQAGSARVMRRPRAAAWLLLLSLLLHACAERIPAPPGVIIVSLATGPNNLDPRIGTDEASQKIGQLLFSSLMRLDDELRVVPGLALSLEQPDPLTYVATLPGNVTFHDGRPLTSADVAYT